MNWTPTRVRYVSELNPRIPAWVTANPDLEVSFLPMESIGDDGTLLLDQKRRVQDVRNGYSFFQDGDIAFAKVTPCFENGKAAVLQGLTEGTGFGTTEITVVRPRASVDGRFLFYVITEDGFKQFGKASMTGAGGLKRVPDAYTRNHQFGLPSLEEQRNVVEFLDRETAKIDELIAKQERLIELLAEKRQAIITQAVTKGLDPSAPTKPSDIPFMGEVPVSWKVSRLGTWILRSIEGGYSPSASNEYPEDGEWGVLALGAVGRADFFGGKVKGVDLDVEVPKNLTVRQGDILLTRSNVRDRVGFAAVVDQARPRTIFPDLIYRLHVSDSVDADYLVLFLSSQPARAQIMSNARGSSDTMPKISHDQIRSWQIPLPPVTIQREIVRHVQKDLSRTDELSRRAVTVITLLKERRSALISAAVTGKIDVREGAA